MTETPNLLNPEPPQPAEAAFVDTDGRKWLVKITVGTVRQLKADMGLDLFASADGSLFKELGSDPGKLCELLWRLVAKQAEERQVEEVAFWEAIDDTALDAATYAFFEALIAFFREDKRGPLRLILAKMKKAEAATVANAQAMAESPKLDRLMESLVNQEREKAEALMDLALTQASKPRPGGP